MLIYPAIDLKAGRCVRLLHGKFDQVTEYDADPAARLCEFADAGATWVHVVDLDGAKTGSTVQHALIGDLARAGRVSIQSGGGVRSRDDIDRLLDLGVARVVVGSTAVRDPETVLGWIDRFGRERICLAFDGVPRDNRFILAACGWTEDTGVDLEGAMARFPVDSATHLLITDVSRDGALCGANRSLLAAAAASRPDLQVQASGGVSDLGDLRALKSLGLSGAIVGKALYERRFSLREALDAG